MNRLHSDPFEFTAREQIKIGLPTTAFVRDESISVMAVARYELSTHLVPDLEGIRFDSRTEPRDQLCGRNAQPCSRCRQHTTRKSPPTCMRCGDTACIAIAEQNREAVSRQNRASASRSDTECRIGRWHLGFCTRIDDNGTVYLIQPERLRSKTERVAQT